MKELAALDIIKKAITIYSANIIHFITPFLASGLGSALLIWYFNQFIPSYFDPTEIMQWLVSEPITIIGIIIVGVIERMLVVMATGLVVKYTSELIKTGKINFKETLYHILNRLPALLVTGLIIWFLTFIGLSLFIVPGIIVIIIFSLVVPSIVIEGRKSLESLSRSRQLVKNRWSKTFVVQILTLLISEIAIWIVVEINFPWTPLITILVSSFVQPINSIALTVLYYSALVKENTPEIKRLQDAVDFCSRCGHRLDPKNTQCPNCGKKRF